MNHNDGPWVGPDDYEKVNGVLRYSRGDNRNGFSLTGMGYWANWDSTDQVAERAVSSGLIPRFGHLDPTDWRARRIDRASPLNISDRRGRLRFARPAFVLHNGLNLFSNFTYFLDDPGHGDQFEQAEQRDGRRRTCHVPEAGPLLRATHRERASACNCGATGSLPWGCITPRRAQRLSTTREDRVGQTMASVYAQTEIEWTRALRTTFGVRADTYQFSVTSDNPLNSGDGVDGMVSPKFGAVFGPWNGTELYANAGMGFHSNDARGAVIRSRSGSGELVDRVTPLVRARGAEVGLRTVQVRGLQSTVALWYLGLDSELVFVGDAGTTEAGRPSRRVGLEWTNYASLRSWLTLDADCRMHACAVRRRRSGRRSDPRRTRSRHLGGRDGRTASGRCSAVSACATLARAPLVEDGSVMSKSTTLWNGEVGYRRVQQDASGARGVQHLRRGGIGHRLLLRVAAARRA